MIETFRQVMERVDPKGDQHHLRLTCVKCGNVQTCRCSAPKQDRQGICMDCCDREGIDWETGKSTAKEAGVKIGTAFQNREVGMQTAYEMGVKVAGSKSRANLARQGRRTLDVTGPAMTAQPTSRTGLPSVDVSAVQNDAERFTRQGQGLRGQPPTRTTALPNPTGVFFKDLGSRISQVGKNIWKPGQSVMTGVNKVRKAAQ